MKIKTQSKVATILGLELNVTLIFASASALILGAAWLSTFPG